MNRRPHQKVVSIEDMSEQELIEFAKVLEAEMSDDLKPCPFCGGEASKIHASGLFERVYCKDCFAQTGGLHSDRAMAKKAWNTRPADAAIEELGAKLAKAVAFLDDLWDSGDYFAGELNDLRKELKGDIND